MTCAEIPGKPDLHTGRAVPDPAPGLPAGFPTRKTFAPCISVGTRARLVGRTAATIQSALLAKALRLIQQGGGIEGRDLGRLLGIDVRAVDALLRECALVQKEHRRSAHVDVYKHSGGRKGPNRIRRLVAWYTLIARTSL